MKNILPAALAAALLFVPLGAIADVTDAPDSGPNMTAVNPAFAQIHAQMQQLHSQARISALNALTPAHRNLLAQVVGQLAISPNPDITAAARVLDSNLGPSEAQALVSISSSLRQQSQQLMAAARQQFLNSLPAGSNQPQTRKVHTFTAGQNVNLNDPGMILLHLTALGLGGHFGH